MGLNIDRDSFEPHEYDAFRVRLGDNIVALSELLQRPDFGEGLPSVGAEVELSLVDSACRPLINRAVLAATLDPQVGMEIDRLLEIFSARVATRTTGAQWQPRALATICGGQPTPDALARMLECYLERAASGKPVHQWSLPR